MPKQSTAPAPKAKDKVAKTKASASPKAKDKAAKPKAAKTKSTKAKRTPTVTSWSALSQLHGAPLGKALTDAVRAERPPKPPRTERYVEGRARRDAVPRASHAGFTPAADRPDPIALLEAQATTRVPELVPIRYGRMMASPFAFYRGAAAIMAADLAGSPTSGIEVQLCGDAHLMNFGLFATPERNLVFGLNDFDETLPGPWEWDLKRLVASLVVAGRSRGFSAEDNAEIVRRCVREYRDHVNQFASMRTLDVWYSRIDADHVLSLLTLTGNKEILRRTSKTVDKARTRDSAQAVSKLTEVVDGERRFLDDPPLIEHILVPGGEEAVAQIFDDYRDTIGPETGTLLDRFRLRDIARKIVGVGSVGTRCWVLLFEGGGEDDPLVLQAKEAQPSVLEPYLGASQYANHAERVVHGQRLIQAGTDIFLGWTENKATGIHYYLRQLRDMKGSAEVEGMDVPMLSGYAGLCGWALARAHAKSGDASEIAGYVGTGEELGKALAVFAEAYADQNEQDHAALVEAVRSGRLVAEEGV